MDCKVHLNSPCSYLLLGSHVVGKVWNKAKSLVHNIIIFNKMLVKAKSF